MLKKKNKGRLPVKKKKYPRRIIRKRLTQEHHKRFIKRPKGMGKKKKLTCISIHSISHDPIVIWSKPPNKKYRNISRIDTHTPLIKWLYLPCFRAMSLCCPLSHAAQPDPPETKTHCHFLAWNPSANPIPAQTPWAQGASRAPQNLPPAAPPMSCPHRAQAADSADIICSCSSFFFTHAFAWNS